MSFSTRLQFLLMGMYCHLEILVCALSHASFLSPQLLEALNQGVPDKRRRRQAERLKPYIAAQVDVLPETFILGDEKIYKGFYNKPLSEDLSYRCFVLASLEDGDTVRTVSVEKVICCLQELFQRQHSYCTGCGFRLKTRRAFFLPFVFCLFSPCASFAMVCRHTGQGEKEDSASHSSPSSFPNLLVWPLVQVSTNEGAERESVTAITNV